MKLYTIVVYNLKIFMKDDDPGLKDIMGDNSREIINFAGLSGILYDLTHMSSSVQYFISCQ